jgi:hypothetical protein
MNKSLFSTSIEALTPDHGREIVNLYSHNGFNTNNFTGLNSKRDGDSWRYYGCDKNGNFNIRSLDEIKKDGIYVLDIGEIKSIIRNDKIKSVITELKEDDIDISDFDEVKSFFRSYNIMNIF